MRVLSLFSGIGGVDLGLERAGMEIVGQCEIDQFCRAVLAKHWPEVWRHDDIRTLDAESFRGRADLVCGGFPCQDVSAACKGAGLGGARSGLWFEMARVVAGVRPAWVLIENVPALRTRGADRVLADLEALGYDAWPLVVGAWAVGAPHRRDRVWIVAHSSSCPNAGATGDRRCADRETAGSQVADADGGPDRNESGRSCGSPRSSASEYRWPSRPGEPQHGWEARRLTQFPVGGSVNGLPVRLVRAANRNALKAYGNAVVPQVVEVIGRAIIATATCWGELKTGTEIFGHSDRVPVVVSDADSSRGSDSGKTDHTEATAGLFRDEPAPDVRAAESEGKVTRGEGPGLRQEVSQGTHHSSVA